MFIYTQCIEFDIWEATHPDMARTTARTLLSCIFDEYRVSCFENGVLWYAVDRVLLLGSGSLEYNYRKCPKVMWK